MCYYGWVTRLSVHCSAITVTWLGATTLDDAHPTLSAITSRLTTSSKTSSPRHLLSLLAPQIRHLLTLRAFINFTYLLA